MQPLGRREELKLERDWSTGITIPLPHTRESGRMMNSLKARFDQMKIHIRAGCRGVYDGGCRVDKTHPFTGICPVREKLDLQDKVYERPGADWKTREEVERAMFGP
jgi:hypothetical protein